MGGRKLKLRHIKNAEKRGSLVVSIPRAQVYVPVAEGLTLFLLYSLLKLLTMVMIKLLIIQ